MGSCFPDSSVGKVSTCNAGDPGLIPGLGRSPGEGKGYPLQYSGLENAMDCIVDGVTKSWTQLSDSHLHRMKVFVQYSKEPDYVTEILCTVTQQKATMKCPFSLGFDFGEQQQC